MEPPRNTLLLSPADFLTDLATFHITQASLADRHGFKFHRLRTTTTATSFMALPSLSPDHGSWPSSVCTKTKDLVAPSTQVCPKFSIGKIVDEEPCGLGVNATPQFDGALTELVWAHIGRPTQVHPWFSTTKTFTKKRLDLGSMLDHIYWSLDRAGLGTVGGLHLSHQWGCGFVGFIVKPGLYARLHVNVEIQVQNALNALIVPQILPWIIRYHFNAIKTLCASTTSTPMDPLGASSAGFGRALGPVHAIAIGCQCH